MKLLYDMVIGLIAVNIVIYFVIDKQMCNSKIVVVFVFNVPPTPKVIWRQGHG